jgi:hypothetical protein
MRLMCESLQLYQRLSAKLNTSLNSQLDEKSLPNIVPTIKTSAMVRNSKQIINRFIFAAVS